MNSLDETREVSLLSTTSNCSYHYSNRNVNLCFSEISIGGDHFHKGDHVLIKSDGDYEVAKLICIFLTYDEITAAVVRKYVFARNVKSAFKKQGYLMDEKNEVVADESNDYVIDLNQIIRKCWLVLLLEDDDPNYIRINDLDESSNFILRFSLLSNKLIPILSETTVLSESSLNSPSSKLRTVLRKSQSMDTENTPEGLVKDSNISNAVKDISTPKRNSVKRNLNKSFCNSPQDNNNSILNYSIVNITDDENDKPLVVKLRVSDKNNSKKLESKLENDGDSSPQVRKSKRNVARQSYADYISPQKGTPTKRQLLKTGDSSDDEHCTSSKTKFSKSTPSRNLKGSSRKNTRTELELSSKRNITTPRHFLDYAVSLNERSPRITPARRSLRFPQAEEASSPTRSVRSRRDRRISYNEDDLAASNTTSSLDDSMRTRILKVKLTKLDAESEEYNLEEIRNEDGEDGVNVSEGRNQEQNNLVLRTPRSKRKPKKFSTSSDEDSDFTVRTPKSRKKHPDSKNTPKPSSLENRRIKQTPRNTTRQASKGVVPQTPKTPRLQTPKTPGSRLKLIREGVVTPSMHVRSEKVVGDSTPLMKARSQLHVSYVPESLPCREKEYCDVYNFIEGKLLDRCGGCMYISGVPGTGKTATVTSVINKLSQTDDVPEFTFVNINGMKLTEPRQSYVEILKQLTGKTVPWEQAQSTLEKMFTKSKNVKPIVMLIDELDILCTKRQDVVYNLLDWPTKAKNQLVVITIANTMDLPERLLMSRVTSRLGLTRLTFHAYTHKQLQEIVTKRLFGTDSFNPDAVQFVSRKVASVSGDARRALDICRRAAEIAEREGKAQMVSMDHVNQALNAMITQPKIRAIKSCSRLEQVIMQSIVAEVGRTGVEETTFADVFRMFETCAAIEGFRRVSITVAMSAVYRLSACRLILTDQKCSDIHQRIILNVSVDDVHYALK
nr:origin recognition complex subunit 1 [Leptinotarsa decemlineata]